MLFPALHRLPAALALALLTLELRLAGALGRTLPGFLAGISDGLLLQLELSLLVLGLLLLVVELAVALGSVASVPLHLAAVAVALAAGALHLASHRGAANRALGLAVASITGLASYWIPMPFQERLSDTKNGQ